MSSSAPVTKPPPTPPPSKPIDVLQTQSSLFYSNLHPILLLSPLLFSFRSLVHDPVTTLLGLAPTIAFLQALYCILCLPSPGPNGPTTTPKPGQKKKPAKTGQDIWGKIVVRSHQPSHTHDENH